MAASLKLLEMLAVSGLTLHEAIRNVPQRATARDQLPCPWERKGMLMRRLIAATKDDQVELVDGVKVHFGNDWIVLYPDPDRPSFHFLAEAGTRAAAEQLVVTYRDMLKGWLAREAA
jgi:mannose-1-phosphate guanylyltransferase/phosphomannomutase